MSLPERLLRGLFDRPDRAGAGLSNDDAISEFQEEPAAGGPDGALESPGLSALDDFDSEQGSGARRPAMRQASEPASPATAGQGSPPAAEPVSQAPTPVQPREMFAAGSTGGSGIRALVEATADTARTWYRLLRSAAKARVPGRSLRPPGAAKGTLYRRVDAPAPQARRKESPPASRQAAASVSGLVSFVRNLPRPTTVHLLIAVTAVLVVETGWYLVTRSPAPSGHLTVTSTPAGAQLLIDGTRQGVTPATVRIPAGDHVLEIRSAGPRQVVSLHIPDGGQISRFFDLPVGTAPATLKVSTTPSGALLTIDGRPRARTPAVVTDLNPGPHRVRVQRGSRSLERVVMLESGGNGALALSMELPGPTQGHGWLEVSVPVEVTAFENGRIVGDTRASPWQLPAGRHDLELVNETLGVHIKRSVDIPAGRTLSLAVAVPSGFLSVTSTPAANVEIDGESLGSSPVVNRAVTPGQHDVVARHPALGERRLTVNVLPELALSVQVDLRRR